MQAIDIDLEHAAQFVDVFPAPCLLVYAGSLRVYAANKSALTLFGESAEHACAELLNCQVSGGSSLLPKKIAQLGDEDSQTWDTRIRRKDGILVEVCVSAQPLYLDKSRMVLVELRDRSKEARQKRYSNLLLGTLAHTTRHDFFEYFAQSLARIINMEFVGICRKRVEGGTQSLAYIEDGKISDKLLGCTGSPQDNANEGKLRVLKGTEAWLGTYPELDSEAWRNTKLHLSVPLVDADGAVLGNIWAVDRGELHDTELIIETMSSYAPMVASELRRRITDDDAERMRARLTQAQKLESLGVLAGGIAHDFNNLLTGIMGNTELALLDLPPGATAKQNLETIRQSAIHAADLCRQMLTYAGQGLQANGPIELNRVVTEMVQLLEVSVSKRAALKLQLDDSLPVIAGDASQLSQIVMNLITNASEALNQDHGSISLTTGAKYCDQEYLARSLVAEHLEPGVYVYLEVRDDGSGMNEDTVERMFDPFYTTKFAGRGLGLSAVLGIVRGHGGTLQLETKQGFGTKIRILFPATELKVNTRDRIAVHIEPDCLRDRTILVADDDKTVLATTRAILTSAGAKVLVANDGSEMVELLSDLYERTQTVIDLALVDLTMPRMDGMEAIMAMREIDPDIKAVLTSGYDENDVTRRFDGKDQLRFLQKPYLSEQLISIIGETLKQSSGSNA